TVNLGAANVTFDISDFYFTDVSLGDFVITPMPESQWIQAAISNTDLDIQFDWAYSQRSCLSLSLSLPLY
ncbi:hypothetical protein KIPB_016377, partial [Kipferlia bialata]